MVLSCLLLINGKYVANIILLYIIIVPDAIIARAYAIYLIAPKFVLDTEAILFVGLADYFGSIFTVILEHIAFSKVDAGTKLAGCLLSKHNIHANGLICPFQFIPLGSARTKKCCNNRQSQINYLSSK